MNKTLLPALWASFNMRVVTIPDTVRGTRRALMLNMLKFKDRRLCIEEYLPAFVRIMRMLGVGAKVELLSDVLASVIADEGEEWDAILIVEYSSSESFLTVAQSDEYREIAEPLRFSRSRRSETVHDATVCVVIRILENEPAYPEQFCPSYSACP